MDNTGIGQRPPWLEWLVRSKLTLLTILWLLVGFALYMSQTWLFKTIEGPWAMAPILVHAGWGALQAFVLLGYIFERRDVRILLPMMLIAAVMFFFGIGLFRRVGDQIAFSFVRGPYDQAVAVATAPRDKPVLIAFPWADRMDPSERPGGAGDVDQVGPTGRAIVYDETDAINLINAYTWQKASPTLGKLLSGKPARCIRFAEPHYYLCSFS